MSETLYRATMVMRELAGICSGMRQSLRLADHGKGLFGLYRAPFAAALVFAGWNNCERLV
jgi:hypothetical protein